MKANGVFVPLAATGYTAGDRMAFSPNVAMKPGSVAADARVSVRKRTFPLCPPIESATANETSGTALVVSFAGATPARFATSRASGARRKSRPARRSRS